MTKHLTEEEIAICAEALENGSYQSLSHDIREHVAHCDECADEILMVADIAHDEQLKITPEVTQKDKTQRIIAWSASIAAAIALILLLFDLSDQSINENGDLLTQETTSEQEQSNATKTSEDLSDQESTSTEDSEAVKSGNKETGITSDTDAKHDNQTSGNQELIAKNQQKEADKTEREQSLPSTVAPTAQMPSSGVPPHLREKADTIRFLAHYEPNEDLEKLVERYKGNLRNTREVNVVTPLAITSSSSSITIKWDNPNKKRLIIEVFNNEGNRILETETTREEYTLEDMEEGLYYWKLISDNFELLFCGKIVIKSE